jgi:SAM-dependent methyltransferase
MNEEARFVAPKSQNQITREWDFIARERDKQLRADDDISFHEVLHPWVRRVANGSRTVIDVGCGTGLLTESLRSRGADVLGIDPSSKSIGLARAHQPHGEYAVATLEEWEHSHPGRTFDLAVVNMVMMDVVDLERFCSSLARVARDGRVIATLTHPSFWPLYWGYAARPDFDYLKETTVEAPFRTTSKKYEMLTTHIHRPLGTYLSAFEKAGMSVRVEELRGAEEINIFPFPRFLALELKPKA